VPAAPEVVAQFFLLAMIFLRVGAGCMA